MTETENTISTGKERNSADHCRISSNSVKPAEAGGEGEKESSSSSSVNSSSSSKKQGKSCNGCLYYSSTDKSNSQSPLCLGLSRSLPQVPQYIVGESEMEASKDDRNLTDFRYACIGYSVYLDQKARSADGQEVQTELPVSVGLEVLVDRKVSSAETAPGHVHKRESDFLSFNYSIQCRKWPSLYCFRSLMFRWTLNFFAVKKFPKYLSSGNKFS